MCCGNPLQGKLLPVGWKPAQWSYELEKKATPHQGIWMSTQPSCFFHRLCIYASPMGIWEISLCYITTTFSFCFDKNHLCLLWLLIASAAYISIVSSLYSLSYLKDMIRNNICKHCLVTLFLYKNMRMLKSDIEIDIHRQNFLYWLAAAF